jgi:hypothetical protein
VPPRYAFRLEERLAGVDVAGQHGVDPFAQMLVF